MFHVFVQMLVIVGLLIAPAGTYSSIYARLAHIVSVGFAQWLSVFDPVADAIAVSLLVGFALGFGVKTALTKRKSYVAMRQPMVFTGAMSRLRTSNPRHGKARISSKPKRVNREISSDAIDKALGRTTLKSRGLWSERAKLAAMTSTSKEAAHRC